MSTSPSPNGANGRDRSGRFAAGNPGGPGNPQAKHVAALRGALLRSVKAVDVEAIIAKLVEAAKTGDTVAAREILDRTIGKPVATDLLQRVEALESQLAQGGSNVG